MNRFVIDAYAWVEYFNGSAIGLKVKDIIEGAGNQVYTNIVTVAELSSHFRKENHDFEEAKKIIALLSLFYHIDLEFADESGKLHASMGKERKHIGMADIFVLLTARKLNAKVVTGDEDFRGLKEALMIK